MAVQLQVGPQIANDGQVLNSRGDNYGSQIVQEYNGRYAELARRGQLFWAQLPAAGQAIILSATTGGHPTLWNPAGSGKLVQILGLSLTWLSGATTAGAFLWTMTKNAGASIGTAAPIVTFTSVAPIPAMIGSATAASTLYAPTTNTFAAAPAFYASTGVNSNGTNGAGYVDFLDYNGMISMMPGNALSLTYSVTTSTSLMQGGILFAEIPLATGTV